MKYFALALAVLVSVSAYTSISSAMSDEEFGNKCIEPMGSTFALRSVMQVFAGEGTINPETAVPKIQTAVAKAADCDDVNLVLLTIMKESLEAKKASK